MSKGIATTLSLIFLSGLKYLAQAPDSLIFWMALIILLKSSIINSSPLFLNLCINSSNSVKVLFWNLNVYMPVDWVMRNSFNSIFLFINFLFVCKYKSFFFLYNIFSAKNSLKTKFVAKWQLKCSN